MKFYALFGKAFSSANRTSKTFSMVTRLSLQVRKYFVNELVLKNNNKKHENANNYWLNYGYYLCKIAFSSLLTRFEKST